MTELKLHPEVGLHVPPILPPARLDYNSSNNHGRITPPGELNEGYLVPVTNYEDYYSVVIDNESCAADTGKITDSEQYSTTAEDYYLQNIAGSEATMAVDKSDSVSDRQDISARNSETSTIVMFENERYSPVSCGHFA